jgi:hypothetical protein
MTGPGLLTNRVSFIRIILVLDLFFVAEFIDRFIDLLHIKECRRRAWVFYFLKTDGAGAVVLLVMIRVIYWAEIYVDRAY